MHLIIKAALDFPDYYGCNWDAFWDCITDMIGQPLHIEIIGLDKIHPEDAEILLELLKDAKHWDDDYYSDKTIIEIVNGDTKINIA